MIAKSFERIHRSNLVGMGIIPLCFKAGEDADTIGLTGHERYSIDLPKNIKDIKPGQDVTVTTDTGKSFTCTVRFDTEVLETLFNSIRFLKSCFRREILCVPTCCFSFGGDQKFYRRIVLSQKVYNC